MSQTPEILVISHKFPPSIGGMQKHCYELTEGLKKRATVHLLIQTKGVSKLGFFFTVVRRAKEMLKEHPGINIIYVNDGLMAYVLTPLLKGLNVSIVATIHGLDVVFPMSFFQRWVGKNLTRYDAIIAVSDATRHECIQRGLSEDKTHTVKNGFEPGPVRLFDERSIVDKLLKDYQLDVREKKVIVSIGRGVKRKGFSWFIRQVFLKLDPSVVYLMVGPSASNGWIKVLKTILPSGLYKNVVLFAGLATDEPEIAAIIKEYHLNSRVRRISGLTNQEVQDVIELADISVMPNLKVSGDFEGFGLVALEAVSKGTLVVASGIEGITSALEHNQNGILLKSADAEDWVRTVQYLLDNPSVVAAKSRDFQKYTLENSHSWSKMVDDYFAIFSQLVNKQA